MNEYNLTFCQITLYSFYFIYSFFFSDSLVENKNLTLEAEFEDKSHNGTSPADCTDVQTASVQSIEPSERLCVSIEPSERVSQVYVSEDANDCNYDESSSQQIYSQQSQQAQQSQQQVHSKITK